MFMGNYCIFKKKSLETLFPHMWENKLRTIKTVFLYFYCQS